jgi:hypothetical protein
MLIAFKASHAAPDTRAAGNAIHMSQRAIHRHRSAAISGNALGTTTRSNTGTQKISRHAMKCTARVAANSHVISWSSSNANPG